MGPDCARGRSGVELMAGRLPDWHRRLTEYLVQRASTPFCWGQNDCACFASGAVEAMTGVDPMAKLRGSYSTKRGAAGAIRRAGFDDLASAVAARFAVCSRVEARPGDLAMIETADGPACAVVQGVSLFVMSQTGLAIVPRSDAISFHKVI